MEVAYIHLSGVVRTWWLAKEVRHKDSLTWENFFEVFFFRFFHMTAKTGDKKEVLAHLASRS